jgi:hypothetical protein
MRLRPLLLACVAAASLGATCAKTRITEPREAQIVPGASVRASSTVLRSFDPASVTVTIDGVDVTAAVGLVPPFADEGAVVIVGGVPVTVSDFDFVFPPNGPYALSLVFTGLPTGSHQLGLTATPTAGGAPTALVRNFVRVDGFADTARATAAAALAAPVPADGGQHRVASIGGEPAGPAVSQSDGGKVRPGFASVSESIRSGGTP